MPDLHVWTPSAVERGPHMNDLPLPFLRSKTGSRGKLSGAFPCVVRRSLGFDAKDLRDITYFGLLPSRMSRTVKMSDH
jgi:hypothetical protein